jgi:hypothetical protein
MDFSSFQKVGLSIYQNFFFWWRGFANAQNITWFSQDLLNWSNVLEWSPFVEVFEGDHFGSHQAQKSAAKCRAIFKAVLKAIFPAIVATIIRTFINDYR